MGIYSAGCHDHGVLVCFTIGLKAGDMAEYPFVLYLISGIIPWFFSRMR